MLTMSATLVHECCFSRFHGILWMISKIYSNQQAGLTHSYFGHGDSKYAGHKPTTTPLLTKPTKTLHNDKCTRDWEQGQPSAHMLVLFLWEKEFLQLSFTHLCIGNRGQSEKIEVLKYIQYKYQKINNCEREIEKKKCSHSTSTAQ